MGITVLESSSSSGGYTGGPVAGGSIFEAPAQVSTVANTTTLLVAANTTRMWVAVSSASTNTTNITLTVLGGAVTDGYILEPGDSIALPCAADVYYRTTAASQTLSVCGVRQ